jgi:pyridoxamine 5'-phosphate oxidase
MSAPRRSLLQPSHRSAHDATRRPAYALSVESDGFLDLDPDPLRQFGAWLSDAQASSLAEPAAMALATVDASGGPQVRMVLLRGFDERGFRFYTNYDSPKGRDVAATPRAALCFFWDPLARQVRVVGTVERADAAESDAYFASRGRGSRIAAWASEQSRPIVDRSTLEARYEEAAARFAGAEVPRPPGWGGFRVVPSSYEFWAGRRDRLHDRMRYTLAADGGWRRERLQP